MAPSQRTPQAATPFFCRHRSYVSHDTTNAFERVSRRRLAAAPLSEERFRPHRWVSGLPGQSYASRFPVGPKFDFATSLGSYTSLTSALLGCPVVIRSRRIPPNISRCVGEKSNYSDEDAKAREVLEVVSNGWLKHLWLAWRWRRKWKVHGFT